MVFTMPAFVIAKTTLLLFCLLCFSLASQAAEQISIPHAKVTKAGNGYTLNATIHYPLSPRIIEAIDHGVPITFNQEFQLIDTFPLIGKYWQWQNTLWSSTIRYQLRYHALSKQYVLIALDTSKQRNFPSLEATLNALGAVEKLNLPPEYLFDLNNITLQIRSGVDIHALPTAMRPGALISNKWQIGSPWVDAVWP
jgi:hypothetical protein